MSKSIVVPLSTTNTSTATLTSPWFVQETEYHPVPAAYQPLINGEETFKAVYEEIAKAVKSIDIVCWGFQPSMHFIRDGKHLSIGALLEKKAKEDKVQVRVLGWSMAPVGVNVSGLGGESNLPGYKKIRLGDRAMQQTSDEVYATDVEWFSKYSEARKDISLRFVGRGFDTSDRAEIFNYSRTNSLDHKISKTMSAVLASTATHHQKMVLIDYESPETAVGFVMGHNMLDEYWDNNTHSVQRFPGHLGANGSKPRQDISSKVNGPILEHLHHNFATAWQRETKEDLLGLRRAKETALLFTPRSDDGGTQLMAQILRTQAQDNKRDIEKIYLQAVNNASSFIYVENQYFRWPPFADAIKKAAKDQADFGRDPSEHDYLYLFVITNSSDEGVGPGTLKTYEMLDSLGRADVIPGIARKIKVKDVSHQIDEEIKAKANLSIDQDGAQKKIDELKKKKEELKDEEISVPSIDIPHLKVHVCTLVAPDPMLKANLFDGLKTYDEWTQVYIHSKLMIINDVFTTHGSANINMRSMEVDSELNIAYEWMSVTQKLRRDLWKMHTNGEGGQDEMGDAYDSWERVLSKNKSLHLLKDRPIAPLVEFYRDNPKIVDQD